MLARLTRLVAIHAPEHERRALYLQVLRSGSFDEVRLDRHGWLRAEAPMDLSEARSAISAVSGPFLFAEGERNFRGISPDQLAARCARSASDLDQFPGDFGFAQLLPDGSALLVRSCGGLVPLYYASERGWTFIATNLSDLARWYPVSLEADLLTHAVWLGHTCLYPWGRTFFKGVSCLPPGHFVRANPQFSSPLAYWHPRGADRRTPDPATTERHAEQLRETLECSIAEGMPERPTSLVWLSGGVDSSVLTALAAAQHKPLATLSFIPPAGTPERERELSYIEPLCRHLRVEAAHLRDLSVDTYRARPARSEPTVSHQLHPGLYESIRLADCFGYEVIMGGEFADRCCGGPQTTPDFGRDTSTRHLVRGLLHEDFSWRSAPRSLKHRLLRWSGRPRPPVCPGLPEAFDVRLREEYGDFRRSLQCVIQAVRTGNATLRASLQLTDFTAMSWEALSPHRRRRLFPFVGREMFEWALSTHPAERVEPTTKQLLRRACKSVVPERNLQRPDKGTHGRLARADEPFRAIPTCFEPLFDARWVQSVKKSGRLSLKESIMLGFLRTFDNNQKRLQQTYGGHS